MPNASSISAALALVVGVATSTSYAQFTPVAPPSASPPTATVMPEPIYWKQNLFLIPYQWSTAGNPSAAQAVILLVSKDRGASWRKISEAKPQVKAFNYHAEGDGEYWFAIRTIDQRGRMHPAGPYAPELCVIVDTTMPRIESLAAQFRGDGVLQVQCRANDQNLDVNSWKFEVQLDASDVWQPLEGLTITTDGQAAGQLPMGARPRALRATVYDRAGNSAAYGVTIADASQESHGASAASTTPPQGWVSASEASQATLPQAGAPASQPWPTDVVTRAPFRLSDGTAPSPNDQVTSYGDPPLISSPLPIDNDFANDDSVSHSAANRADIASEATPNPNVSPLEPYREANQPFRRASLTRLPRVADAAAPPTAPPVGESPTESSATVTSAVPPQPASHLPPGVEPKRVGSRTFALEYELEDFGRGGLAKVELWATRDGGQTWHMFATDNDHRSPLVVTVDEAGLYGFRIVVESAGGVPAFPPRAGEQPELWVEVDLRQPTAELTSIRLGTGNQTNRLLLNWRAGDDNLDPRPIALFYSSRPTGPWTAIATNLENTGQYAWQIENHVPDRIYLRLEARDLAGNLTAYQTREPVTLPTSQPRARLRGAEPIGPTATTPATELR